VRDEVVGPAGPTTATRMDKFTEPCSRTGLFGMVGKAERGPVAIEAIKKHQSAYLMAVGGAAYLVSKAIKAAKVVGFADLGMEAIYEFEVKDMPVTVAVDRSSPVSRPPWWRTQSPANRRNELQWRASPHCMVVNLVRSGRKQPKLFSASAGG
jgi:fumarate hydratase, class I